MLPALHRLRLSPSARHAVGLMLASSFVRSLGALASVVLAYGLGTSAQMDLYTAMSLAVVSATTLGSLAIPGVLARYSSQGGRHLSHVARAWGRRLGNRLAALFVLTSPGIAWLMTPGTGDNWAFLTALLLASGLAVWAAPRAAVEQTLLQHEGRPYYALCAAFLSMGLLLAAAVVTTLTGQLWWSAAALSAGAVLELRWLRLGTSQGEEPAAPSYTTPFPSGDYLLLSAAAVAAFLVPTFDQVLLARMGQGAQAVWGLASKVPSFLAMSLFAVVAAMSTRLLLSPEQVTPSAIRRLCLKTLAGTGAVMFAVAAFALPLTATLYERGAFGLAQTHATAAVMTVSVWTYMFYPVSVVLIRAAGAQGARQALVISTLAFVVVKVGVGLFALAAFGYWAVAASTAAATAAQCGCLWLALRAARNA